MLSNEVVARARRLVGEHVLENLLAVSKKEWYEHAFTESLHPLNRASFCPVSYTHLTLPTSDLV